MEKRILIADDEDVLRMLIVDTLEDEGYHIEEATNGEEAYEMAKNNNYDLLVLDYMMPSLTGIEVIRKIRESNGNSNVLILLLTAKNQQKDMDDAMNAGANFFLSKPFSPMKLIELVEEILHV